MSSIMTNASAMTALQTLKATNKEMSTTQARISTGYKVSQASDNAAYWSIATTMRSDNKAMGTVQEALGLGAAMVDVAYTAMDTTKDYLNEIKKRLVSATQEGVDKAKIQSEIDQFKSAIESLASSASFSGANWLSVDSSSGAGGTKSIVSSFTRDADNNISLGTIAINVDDYKLFETSASGTRGLLQSAGPANDMTGGLVKFDPVTPSATATMQAFGSDAMTLQQYDELTFEISIDGGDAVKITVDQATVNAALGVTTGEIADADEFATVLTKALQNENITVGAGLQIELDGSSGSVEFTAGTSVTINNITLSGAGADTDLSTLDITNMSDAQLAGATKAIDGMLGSVITKASDLGAIKSRIDMQKDFVSNLMDAVDRGVGALVDADMEEESTRLQALQVQQQLGIQALSIANSNAQNLLSLFR